MYEKGGYLIHYGIHGQKWGVRRFQNPDGSLTSEGKARYYDSLDSDQKRLYNQLAPRDRNRLNKKLVEGKDWNRALQEMNREAGVKAAVVSSLILYANPYTRYYMKAGARLMASFGKAAFRAMKNSNVVQRGSLWLKKMMSRRSMVKNGSVVLNKNDFSVKDIPFGGYLKST